MSSVMGRKCARARTERRQFAINSLMQETISNATKSAPGFRVKETSVTFDMLSNPKTTAFKVLDALTSSGEVTVESLLRILAMRHSLDLHEDKLRQVLSGLQTLKKADCAMRGPSDCRTLHWRARRGW